MPLRLKSLELVGYKTFASKTEFEFSDHVTVIVGPNGSGKSNIADALRWVLGEQSYTLMRGRKTDDMIFSGSEGRSRAGMASATVTFDNSDGWLPIDFSEVSITRRAYRDGRNDYLINGQRVRLMDVTELLSKSGLAERTYTVIGQGLVDTALSLRAEERRRLFEEAAGIGLYRKRKEQALRRLDQTRRNLERVQDILAELAPRLRSLSRQAKRAEEFEALRSELQEVLREWYGFHWHRAQRELLEARKAANQQEEALENARENHRSADAQLSALRDQINGLRARLGSWHRELAELHSKRETTSRELAVSDERQRALLERESRLSGEVSQWEQTLAIEQERLGRARTRLETVQAELDDAQAQAAQAREDLQTRLVQRTEIEAQINALSEQITTAAARKAEQGARQSELELRLSDYDTEKDEFADLRKKAEEAFQSAERLHNEAVKAREEAGSIVEKLAAQCAMIKDEIAASEDNRKTLESQMQKAQTDAARQAAQLDVLIQAEQALSGYASGAKLLLEAVRDQKLNGTEGALSGQLTVPEHLEKAVAAALGDYVDAVLVGGGKDADNAMALLENARARAALLPLGDIVPHQPVSAPDDRDCLGCAADLIEAPARLRPVLDLLLGETLVVKDRKAARRLLTGAANGARAVTLSGEVFASRGPILVNHEEGGGLLGRARERGEIEMALGAAHTQVEGLENELQTQGNTIAELITRQKDFDAQHKAASEAADRAQVEYQRVNLAFGEAKRELEWELQQSSRRDTEREQALARIESLQAGQRELVVQIEKDEIVLREKTHELAELTVEEQQAEVSHWETQLAVATQSMAVVNDVHAERRASAEKAEEGLTGARVELAEIDVHIKALRGEATEMRTSEGGIGSEIDELRQLIDPAEAELREAEAGQQGLEAREAELRNAMSMVERHNAQSQLAHTRAVEALDRLRDRIEEDFGLVEFSFEEEVSGQTPLPLGEGMVVQLPVVTEIGPDVEENLKRVRMQIRRMGAINPEATREYNEVKERHEFMLTQIEDLEKAEVDLLQIVGELDEMMERDFLHTFERVAAEFKVIFTRLFGGGSARLILTEADEINEEGIDIEARLPGKRMQRLAMLSGGERSLTASALVFSLIKASPTPFCVMDEIDAALDESNVGRLRGVLEELAAQTQFIVITHNRSTVQAAETIYGITMGRDSTSQSISLKLEDVDGRYSE
jgi:chromosome segregation protein